MWRSDAKAPDPCVRPLRVPEPVYPPFCDSTAQLMLSNGRPRGAAALLREHGNSTSCSPQGGVAASSLGDSPPGESPPASGSAAAQPSAALSALREEITVAITMASAAHTLAAEQGCVRNLFPGLPSPEKDADDDASGGAPAQAAGAQPQADEAAVDTCDGCGGWLGRKAGKPPACTLPSCPGSALEQQSVLDRARPGISEIGRAHASLRAETVGATEAAAEAEGVSVAAAEGAEPAEGCLTFKELYDEHFGNGHFSELSERANDFLREIKGDLAIEIQTELINGRISRASHHSPNSARAAAAATRLATAAASPPASCDLDDESANGKIGGLIACFEKRRAEPSDGRLYAPIASVGTPCSADASPASSSGFMQNVARGSAPQVHGNLGHSPPSSPRPPATPTKRRDAASLAEPRRPQRMATLSRNPDMLQSPVRPLRPAELERSSPSFSLHGAGEICRDSPADSPASSTL